jgi:hypothetical protein
MVEDIMQPPSMLFYQSELLCADEARAIVVGMPSGFPCPGTTNVFMDVLLKKCGTETVSPI